MLMSSIDRQCGYSYTGGLTLMLYEGLVRFMKQVGYLSSRIG